MKNIGFLFACGTLQRHDPFNSSVTLDYHLPGTYCSKFTLTSTSESRRYGPGAIIADPIDIGDHV